MKEIRSADHIRELQAIAFGRHKKRLAILDVVMRNQLHLQMFTDKVFQQFGTLTELPQMLGHIGYIKWEDRENGN